MSVNQRENDPRYLLIDDDPVFSSIMVAAAFRQGIHLEAYPSLKSMHSVGNLGHYQGVILDYQLDQMTGVEIGQYMSAFFPATPVVLVSAGERRPESSWPPCIREFVPKSAGHGHVLASILGHCHHGGNQ